MKFVYIFVASFLLLSSCKEKIAQNPIENNSDSTSEIIEPIIEEASENTLTEITKTTEFKKDNVSFELPTTWHVMRNDAIPDGDTHLVIINQKDLGALSFIIVQWSNEDYTADEYMEMSKDFIEQVTKSNGIEFKALKKGIFNSGDAQQSDFVFSIMNFSCEGKAFVFKKGQKTFAVTKMGAIDDAHITDRVFELVEKSLATE